MAYVGPCYLCGQTIGEYETRVYVGGGKKGHPACQPGSEPDASRSTDTWSFADTAAPIEGLHVVSTTPHVINGESSKRIRVRKTAAVGVTELPVAVKGRLGEPVPKPAKRSHKRKPAGYVSGSDPS